MHLVLYLWATKPNIRVFIDSKRERVSCHRRRAMWACLHQSFDVIGSSYYFYYLNNETAPIRKQIDHRHRCA